MRILAQELHLRPCDLAGYDGTSLERLFFDIIVMRKEDDYPESSTRARIMKRRAQSGLYTS